MPSRRICSTIGRMKTRLRRLRRLSTDRTPGRPSGPRRFALIGLLVLATPGAARLFAAEPTATRLILRDGWLLHRDDS